MTSRREFLQVGLAAASAWPLASQVAQASNVAIQGAPALPLYKVVYDARFSQSVSFAQRAEQIGMVAHAIEGDMTRLWCRCDRGANGARPVVLLRAARDRPEDARGVPRCASTRRGGLRGP